MTGNTVLPGIALAGAKPPMRAKRLALAMGLQNAAMTHFAGTSINTAFP